jgi:peptidoglycan/LPS O-acetylase OafA/YrhL
MGCCVSQIAYQYQTPAPIANPTTVDNPYNPRLFDDPEAAIDYFPSQKFYRKRASRLAPVYYFTNLLAIPLSILTVGIGFFIYTAIVSLFLISSWVIMGPLNGVLWTISTMSFFYCMFPHLIVRLQQLHTAVDFRY